MLLLFDHLHPYDVVFLRTLNQVKHMALAGGEQAAKMSCFDHYHLDANILLLFPSSTVIMRGRQDGG